MALIITSIILTIITSFILGCGLDEKKWKFRPRMLFGLAWLVIILFGCFKSVKTGEIGIKTRFGKITNQTISEGINFKLPYERIEKVNIKVQKYENEQSLSTSTRDMQIVNNIQVSVNYQIDGEKAVDLYKQVGTNYKNTILEPAIQETIKGVISKYTSEELVTKRSEISLDICNTLNERIKNYGINSVSVAINNFDFGQSYNEAIEKKAVAEQEVQTQKNKLEKAKVEAETKKVEAQGEADANKIKEKSLTDKIIQQQFIEKWNGQLPNTYTGGDVMGILNLK